MSTKLGENILTYANALNLSQKELATMIGVTDTTMSRYINGTREPKIEVLSNLATALRTTVDELIGQQNTNNDDDEYPQLKRLIARNSKSLSMAKKRELINALLSEEE
ncbi:helix-turn-helix domain-containing protein [Lacticaseibacillus hegangensis]|uniref:Helix-turn-helix domain-containing protein n=1 Tax=Lacticaseibacillus hegangensis TaxID=2486010 RepID=A0ABW4CV56_9LACO|nr:helix-turn-helix transcriptional regulator [Lacticaseibacillus hegangensis]